MFRYEFTAVVALICSSTLAHAADQWQPAEAQLATRWAKDVSPERVWPEYPRPQMVRPDWVNLNGLWEYAIRPKADEKPQEWDGKILVPFAIESALSGVKKPVTPEQRLWYRRTFAAPKLTDGGRLLCVMGSAPGKATLYLRSGGDVSDRALFDASAPRLPGFARTPAFIF